jgi:hypothetical protein
MSDEIKKEDSKREDDDVEKFCSKVGIEDCNILLKILSYDYESDLSDDENIKEMLKSLVKKLDRICDDLEPVLDPGNNISDIKEAAFFDDSARKSLAEMYGKIKHLIKRAKLISLEYDRNGAVSMANDIVSFWKKNNESITRYYEGLVACWETSEKNQYSLSYFG